MSRRPGHGSKAPNSATEPSAQAPDNWDDVDDKCPLCRMEKRTRWYAENSDAVVANTLGGSPFVVLKRHTTEPTDEELESARNLAKSVFGEHDELVLMNIVENHYHHHIRNPEKRP